MNETGHKLSQIPKAIWILGLVTLLMNTSSIMIFSLAPLYITHVFGLATFQLGILEGCVEFFSWMTRIFSGVISDCMRKRKPLLIAAYALTVLSRPLFAIAPTILWVYVAKLTDRFSNGIQASPREALVGDYAPKEIKGTCYGLRQSLGLIGSAIGAIAVVYLMRSAISEYQNIFYLATIPSLAGLATIIFFVKDKGNRTAKHTPSSFSLKKQLEKIPELSKNFWTITLVSGIFMISNYSGSYRILQAERVGVLIPDIALTMIVQNIGALLSAFPIGKLSDTFDRRILLAIGFCITIAANIFLAFMPNMLGMGVGSALWGMQMGITQSIFTALVADATHYQKELRGTAFGLYYLTTAVALFLANCIMGFIFDLYGSGHAFLSSACIAAIAIPLLSLIKPAPKTVPT